MLFVMGNTNTSDAETKPDRTAVLTLAAKACVDPRTAARALRGEPVKGLAAERIRAALACSDGPGDDDEDAA